MQGVFDVVHADTGAGARCSADKNAVVIAASTTIEVRMRRRYPIPYVVPTDDGRITLIQVISGLTPIEPPTFRRPLQSENDATGDVR